MIITKLGWTVFIAIILALTAIYDLKKWLRTGKRNKSD
jgi:hypothetical protein